MFANPSKELLLRLKNADQEAFRQVFDIYVKKIYNFVFSHIKEKTEAEDITQNIFIKIWEKKEYIDPDRSFEGLLFTIAHRMLLDYFRSPASRFSIVSVDPITEQAKLSPIQSDDLVHRRQLESLYNKALQRLPAKRKEIFLLSRHQGLSNKQIAEKLGISIKTVENQMTAALGFLRDFFNRTETGATSLLLIYFF